MGVLFGAYGELKTQMSRNPETGKTMFSTIKEMRAFSNNQIETLKTQSLQKTQELFKKYISQPNEKTYNDLINHVNKEIIGLERLAVANGYEGNEFITSKGGKVLNGLYQDYLILKNKIPSYNAKGFVQESGVKMPPASTNNGNLIMPPKSANGGNIIMPPKNDGTGDSNITMPPGGKIEQLRADGIFDKKVGTTTNFASQEDVNKYVDYAYRYADETNDKGNDEFPKQKNGIIIGQAEERLINDLKEHFGVDVSGAYHTLMDNDIRHVKNSHGEKTNEKYPVTAQDQKQIPNIIKHYDDVLYVETGGKKGIYYVKRHNGVTYYLEAIINEGRTLSNKQMIKVATGTIPNIPGLKDAINKKWNIDSVPNDSKIPRMYVQDVENNYVPDNNIPQSSNVVNKKNHTGTPLYERLEAMSQNNEPITVDDVKKVTGFGEEGAKLVAELANGKGVTFSQAERAVKNAYLAGMANVEGTKVNFETDTQINAFTAGKKDRVMQDLADKKSTKKSTLSKKDVEGANNLSDIEFETITNEALRIQNDAESVQQKLNQIMGNAVNKHGLVKYFGGTKSVKSMVEKVIRKKYNEGVDYDLMSMKDHARGTININSYEEASTVVNELMSQIPNAQLEVKNNPSGYFGIHITGNIDGMNVEVQVHTEEASRIKEISDEIYHKWRNINEKTLTDVQKAERSADYNKIADLYSDYFAETGLKPAEIISSIDQTLLLSNTVPKTPSNGSQESPLSSRTPLGKSVQSNRRVLSSERNNELSGTSRPPIDTNVDITTPPDNLIIQENGGDVNNQYMQNGLNNITESDIINKNGGADNDIRTDSNSSGQERNQAESAGEQGSSVSGWRRYGNRRINESVRIRNENRTTITEIKGKRGEVVSYYSAAKNEQRTEAELFIENEAKKYGIEVEYATELTVTSKDGKVSKPVAFIKGNNVVLSDKATFKDALHEFVHYIRRTNPGKYNAIKKYIADNMNPTTNRLMLDVYIQKYSEIYGFGDINSLSEVERAQAMDIIYEEMVCDLVAYNKTGSETSMANEAEFTDIVNEYFDESKNSINYNSTNRQNTSKSTFDSFFDRLEFLPLPKTKNGNIKRNIAQNSIADLMSIVTEYGNTGILNQEKAEGLFELLYNSSVVEKIDNFDDAVNTIKGTKLYISPEDRGTIPDFNKFRQSMFKKLDITTDKAKGGLNVDVFFDEFISSYPGMVDETLTHPADQLQALADFVTDVKNKRQVTLDEYFGTGATAVKEQMQEMFNDELDAFVKGEEIRFSYGESEQISNQEYTDEEYRDFGWARENEILSAGQNADYRSKFAMVKSGLAKFPKSKNGEFIIPVSDIYDASFEGINNVLVFSKGTIDKPIITKIIEIYEYDETSLDRVRRVIYDSERRGIQPKVRNVFRQYYSHDFGIRQQRTVFGGFEGGIDNSRRGGGSEETSYFKRKDEEHLSNSEDVRYSTGTTEKSTDYYKQRYAELLEEYGAIEKGEQPRVDVEVPKQSSDKKFISYHARTFAERGGMSEGLHDIFVSNVVDGIFSYDVISDKKASAHADEIIDESGYDGAVAKWDVISDGKKIGKYDLALGYKLYEMARESGDNATAARIMIDMVSDVHNAAQVLQAASLLKKLGPDGRLYALEKYVKRVNRHNQTKRKGKNPIVKIDPKLAENALSAKGEEAQEQAYQAIEKNIAEQLPSTWGDRSHALRYTAMLFNPKTHIKNFGGNGVMFVARHTKDAVGGILETAFRLPKAQRTKPLPFSRTKDSKKFAKADWKNVKAAYESESSRYDIDTSTINKERKIFTSKAFSWLESLRKFAGDTLEKEDILWGKLNYIDVFSHAMSARGYTSEFLSSGTPEANKALNELRAYSVFQAQKATFRDTSKLAETLTKMRKVLGENFIANYTVGLGVDAATPFVKTPVNVARRGIEYSPAGVISTATQACRDVINSIEEDFRNDNGTVTVKSLAKGIGKVAKGLKNKQFDAATLIDNVSASLVGSALLALGMWAAFSGVLKASSDDEDDAEDFKKSIGEEQTYSLDFGDFSYSIDWVMPISLPFFVGGEIGLTMRKDNDIEKFNDYMEALSRIADPLLEQTMLSGLENILSAPKYSNGPASAAVVAEAYSTFAGQYIPSLGGAIARTIDGTKRNVYYDDKTDGGWDWANEQKKEIYAKLPFLSKTLEPSINEWGEEESRGTFAERFFENFISPGNIEINKATSTDKALIALYEDTGESIVIPKNASKSFVYDGQTINLSVEDYTIFAKERGQMAYKYVTSFINSSTYRWIDDELKVDVISDLYDYATKKAQTKVSRYTLKSEHQKVKDAENAGISPEKFYVAYHSAKDFVSDKNSKGNSIQYSKSRKEMQAIKKNVKGLSEKSLYKLFEIMGYTDGQIKDFRYNLPRKN